MESTHALGAAGIGEAANAPAPLTTTESRVVPPAGILSGKVAFDLPKDAVPETLRLTTGLVTNAHPVVVDLSGS